MTFYLSQVCAASLQTSTHEWLEELKKSFKTRSAAQEQCARDWPRMNVFDHRSMLHKAWDYALGNELLDHFCNQSTMAKPFEIAMKATAALANDLNTAFFLVQCSNSAFELSIHSSGDPVLFTLRKRFVIKCMSDGRSDEGRSHDGSSEVRRKGSSDGRSDEGSSDGKRVYASCTTPVRTKQTAEVTAIASIGDVNPVCVGTFEAVVRIGSDISAIVFIPV